MRCRDARKRLISAVWGETSLSEDNELRDHLARCPNCPRHAAATARLREVLNAASADDTADVTPLSEQRHAVEMRASQRGGRRPKPGFPGISPAKRRMKRLRYSAGLAVTVAALALVALVPFGYERTVGYDVAFAGVCRELGGDGDKVCDVLFELGLDDADVDFLGCDGTCNLLVVDLKSEEEVDLVVDAFNGICPVDPVADVIPIVTRTSGSLLHQANEKVFTGHQMKLKVNDVYQGASDD